MISYRKTFCNKCRKDLSAHSFGLRSSGKPRSWCIDCEKMFTEIYSARGDKKQDGYVKMENDNTHKYCISNEQFDTILTDQKNACAICKKLKEKEHLVVDYNNSGETVRGVLCTSCSSGLEFFKDSSQSIARAIGHLASHQASGNEAISDKELAWLMQCVESSRRFSTCAKANYYAILVDIDGFQVSQGWNGVPTGFPHCVDGGCDRAIENSKSGSSYSNCPAQHAEMGAVLRADRDRRRGATIFVNGTPCYECAKLIVHSGISRVVYIKDEQYDTEKQLSLWGIAKISYSGVRYENLC